MTSLRQELLEASKNWIHKIGTLSKCTPQKVNDNEVTSNTEELKNEQEKSQDVYSDFEKKLASLKECIADVKEQSDEYFSSQKMINKIEESTQTLAHSHAENHIISIVGDSSDEENARERLDRDVELLKREIGLTTTILNDEKGFNSEKNIEDWKEIIDTLKKRITDGEAEKNKLQDQITELEETLWNKEEQLIKLNAERCQKLERQHNDDDDKNKKIDNIVQQYKIENVKLKNEIKKLEEDMKIIKFNMEKKNKENEILKESYDKKESMNEDINDFMKELKLIRKQNELLQMDNEKLKNESIKKDQYMNEIQKSIRNNDELIVKKKEEIENEAAKYREEMKILKDQCVKLKRESEAKDLDIASLVKDTDILSDEMKNLRSELSDAHMNSLKYENEIKNLNNENESLKQYITKSKEERNNANQEYMTEMEKLKNDLNEAKRVQEMFEIGMKHFKEQSNNLTNEINNLRNNLNTVKTENETLKMEATNRRKEVERLSR